MTSGSSRREDDAEGRSLRVLWIGACLSSTVSPDDVASQNGSIEAERVDTVDAAVDVLAAGSFDCIVTEHCDDGVDGPTAVDAIRDHAPRAPVVVLPIGAGAVAGRGLDANATVFVPPTDAEAGAAAIADLLQELDRERTRPGTQGEMRMPIKDRTMAEELRLKELAMDWAPIGITISGMDHPDNPLIYINDSFEEITGYDKERSIGCNCRFLQGPDTDAAKID
ncbi:MAG: PAS domain-containing protein, partial [Halobacteriales archaeon]